MSLLGFLCIDYKSINVKHVSLILLECSSSLGLTKSHMHLTRADLPKALTIMDSRPPLKWAGGKYNLVPFIRARLPAGKRLIEPFAGSCVLSLNTKFSRYLCNDSNTDLINLYQHIKKEGEAFIRYAKRYFVEKNNDSDVFYRLREVFNTTDDLRKKAALFLYINKFGYNGLCRYNLKGECNTPFGKYDEPYFPAEELRYFYDRAKKVTFTNRDFEEIMSKAKSGDVIYCDPPYVPLSETANFTAYSAGGFSADDQVRLANLAEALSDKGIPVVISNHCTKATLALYKNADITRYQIRRMISCNGVKREHAEELIAVYS